MRHADLSPARDPHESCGRIDTCVVTYNSAATIDALVSSLLAEREVATVRILDNASRDATPQFVEQWVTADARVSLTRLTRNVGFPAGCNMLLRECTSAFVLVV